MKYSLRTKITVAFFSMALILILFINMTANYFLQNGFKEYTINKMKDESNAIVSQISDRYSDVNGKWNINNIESIGHSAMARGLLLKVVNAKSEVIWDAREYNKGYCAEMLSRMETNMRTQNPNFKGAYEEKSYDLVNGSVNIGKVYIGYYGPYFYSDSDVKYVKTLNQVLLGAGVLALILSIIMGYFLANRLSKPIKKVIENAKRISKGEFDTKIVESSNTKEIVELTDTINLLGETLGTQETLRKRLSSDIAHELRTPLTTLQSHLELIIDGIWLADEERLKILYEEAVRLGKMVGDLGKVAQLEGENLVLDKTEIDIDQIGESVIKAVEGEFFKKGITLTYTAEKSKTIGDLDKIKQIFMNLVSNALKYTKTGGQVDVTVNKTLDKIIINVKDNGMGIPEEDLPHIFERFYRVDKSRARITGGTGIGLAITKALVEAHGGRIFAISKNGEGSSFTVELPERT